MKAKILVSGLFLVLTTTAGFAETLSIYVNGMKCGFCAQGIEKKLRAESAVKDVKVDLEKNLVTVDLKEKQALSDEQVNKLLEKAGYAVESIERAL